MAKNFIPHQSAYDAAHKTSPGICNYTTLSHAINVMVKKK